MDAKEVGREFFDSLFMGPDDRPGLNSLASALESAGVRVNSDSMAEAVEGFQEAQAEHYGAAREVR